MIHEIVVVGGNISGVQLAHHLLRKTLPALSNLDDASNDDHSTRITYHLTLISPNTHLFFKTAAPRALLNPTLIPTDRIFKPLGPAFAQYGARFTHVVGKAVDLDVRNQEVVVDTRPSSSFSSRFSSNSGGGIEPGRRIRYDSLVIATGASTASALWSVNSTHEDTLAALQTLHAQLPSAESVVVAGGGAVGVETAGEIAAAYPGAKVTLVGGSGGHLLGRERVSLGIKAEDMLERLGVEVRLGVKLADANASSTTRPIPLSDRTWLNPSVFINATGPRTYNTSWLPADWLDDAGQVLVRDGCFRVGTDPHAAESRNVYVIGDAAAGYRRTSLELDAMVPTAASSIAVDIIAERGLSSPASFRRSLLGSLKGAFVGPAVGQQVEFKPMRDTIIVPVGPKGGVGQVLGQGVPSVVVKKRKAEKFGVERVEALVWGWKFD